MSDQEAGNAGVTIPLGSGYDAPKIWFKGDDSDVVRGEVIKAFGFPKEWADRSLDEVVVEASRWGRGIYGAANKLGGEPKLVLWTLDINGKLMPLEAKAEEPAPEAAPSNQHGTKAKKRAPGLAAQAVTAGEPSDYVSVEALIENATSADQLREDFDESWTPAQVELAKAKVAELEKA